MALYPITFLDAVTAGMAPNPIPSATLVAIPIDMSTVQMTQLTVAQLSFTQNYSLRAWLSVYPAGIPLPPDAPPDFFPVLGAMVGLPIVIYTATQTPPGNTLDILVDAGSYIFNILNLTNELNVFGFSKTDLA